MSLPNITELFMGSIAQSMDPNYAMAKQFMGTSIKTQESQLIENLGTTVEKLADLLAKAKQTDAPQSVITAYEKLIASANALA